MYHISNAGSIAMRRRRSIGFREPSCRNRLVAIQNSQTHPNFPTTTTKSSNYSAKGVRDVDATIQMGNLDKNNSSASETDKHSI